MLYKDDELLPKSHHHANVALVASKNEEELEEHKKKVHEFFLSEFGKLAVGVKVLKLLTMKDTKLVFCRFEISGQTFGRWKQRRARSFVGLFL